MGSEPSKQQGHVAEDPEESEIGESGFPETRDSCTRKSRYAILRYNQDRPSEGQVSKDPRKSQFGESGFSEARTSCMLESRFAISRREF
jgi:hypothetical protein